MLLLRKLFNNYNITEYWLNLFHSPSICATNTWWPTQLDENNFMTNPYFLQPTPVITL